MRPKIISSRGGEWRSIPRIWTSRSSVAGRLAWPQACTPLERSAARCCGARGAWRADRERGVRGKLSPVPARRKRLRLAMAMHQQAERFGMGTRYEPLPALRRAPPYYILGSGSGACLREQRAGGQRALCRHRPDAGADRRGLSADGMGFVDFDLAASGPFKGGCPSRSALADPISSA